jgi:PAS domain S-box-containing protein
MPILLFDDREQILAVSDTWLEETGYSRQELRCIEDWTARAYGERSGKVLKHIRRIISTEPEAQRAEPMIRTKDGPQSSLELCFFRPGNPVGRTPFVCVHSPRRDGAKSTRGANSIPDA